MFEIAVPRAVVVAAASVFETSYIATVIGHESLDVAQSKTYSSFVA